MSLLAQSGQWSVLRVDVQPGARVVVVMRVSPTVLALTS